MRLFGKLFMILCFTMAAASLVAGQPPGGQDQPPGGKKQGKGGKGKGKGGQGTDYISLLKNGTVKDELKVTDQQQEKLPAVLQKALAEVLTAQQLQRLREIYMQQLGNNAFLDANVKTELKLTPDQGQKIQAALDNQAKEQNEMFQAGGFDPEKMQQLQEDTLGKIKGVLTNDQKTAWTKMLGQPFELQGGGFGGFGGGGFGFKKDKQQ